MQKIRILPKELQNRIAAGEVVERPASVVKELLENSLDAGAKEINTEILNGGRRLIRVSDNGAGMDRDDAMLCFHHHATSKIENEDDLFNIITLGFRGEALSSIASVSRMRLMTAPAGSTLGVEMVLSGGELVETRTTAHSGTTVEVNDLFFNTPARKKFLKSTRTEVYHIIETVTETALSHPETGFSLTIDRTEALRLPKAANLKERVLQIYGDEFLNGLLEVTGEALSALISKEGNYRSTRSSQYIFINRRPIRDASLRHAVYRAYDTLLPKEKHPLFFLSLTIPPSDVDFNVHPAKREVRFRERDMVYRMAHDATRAALTGRAATSAEGVQETAGDMRGSLSVCSPEYLLSNTDKAITATPLISEDRANYSPDINHLNIGDVFIAYTNGSGVTLLDHHAAHERVIYERLKRGMNLDVTALLFPKQVRLSGAGYRAITGNLARIRQMGIDAEDFGENTLLIRALPDFLFNADISSILPDIAHSLVDTTSGSPMDDIRDRIAKRIACHASLRGALRLTKEELRRLLDDLSRTDDPEHCPHGRPTRIHIDTNELKRMFKRTG